MKITSPIPWSIAATAVILAAGIWTVRRNESDLDELKRKSATVKAEASVEPIPAAPRLGEEKPAQPKAPKVEISMVAAVAAESIASRAEGRMKTEEERKHQSELDERINALDEAQLEEFASEVASDPQVPPAEKQWWISKAIQKIGTTDLDKAIELLGSEKLAVMRGSSMANAAITMLLGRIAATDPDKAFRTLDSCAAKLPGLDMQQMNSRLLQTVARNDAEKALQLMESRLEPFGPVAVATCLQFISTSSFTEEQSLALLNYMNSYFTRLKDEGARKNIQKNIVTTIGSNLAKKGQENAIQWMERAKVSRELYLAIGNSAAVNSHGPEIGKWLEWITKETPYQSTPEEERSDWCLHVRNIALDWVEADTTAFGKWLETQKPGEVKNMCIVEFAHAIAGDHPDTAAEWVKQITYEDDRKFMFREIFMKGGFPDPGAREAFAKKYGIE